MRRLLILAGALGLMACQTPGQPALKSVKPKAKPSASASVRTTASRSPAASVNPTTTPTDANSASPSGGSTGATPAPSPVLDLVVGDQTADTWVAGPSLQRPRAGLAAASVSNQLFVLEGDHRPSLELFAPGASAWVLDNTHDGPMNPGVDLTVPLGITLAAVSVRGNSIYTAGGSIGLGPIASVLRYTDVGYAGSAGAVPEAVKAAAGGIIGDDFYVAGGMGADGDVTGALQVIDVVDGGATQLTALPKPVGGAAAAVVDNKLYVLGGYNFEGGEITAQASVQIYHPTTDTWITDASAAATKPAPLPVARHSAAAAVLGGKIYLVGGSGVGGGAVDVVSVYDPKTNTWTTGASLPTPRSMLALAAHADRLWAIGGVNQDGRVLSTVEVYRP